MRLWNKNNLLNVLLVFLPVAVGLHWAAADDVWIFAASAMAIIPLAGLMGRSTEMLAERTGPGIGGLLNASFGNAAELIIAVFALKEGLTNVVKASITGSILGNILLVLGGSFLVGGLRFKQQRFNATAARMASALLCLAVIGLLVPAFFHVHLEIHGQRADEGGVSLEIAGVLLFCYLLMLLFSLKTHSHLYNPASEVDAPASESATQESATHDGIWSVRNAVIVLVVATLCVTWMSHLLVHAIESASAQLGWTQFFMGVVVVAIVGNAAEHSTAILMAAKNRMDLSCQIAIGSGLQIALFVAPVLVLLSYVPGFTPIDLRFSLMEVMAISAAVVVVSLVVNDGESNWLEGLLLLAVYAILAIAFFHLPEPDSRGPHTPTTAMAGAQRR